MKAVAILSFAAAAVSAVAVPEATRPQKPSVAELEKQAAKGENVLIEHFQLEWDNTQEPKVSNVSFVITADKANLLPCQATYPKVAPWGQNAGIYNCVNADSKYRFSLYPSGAQNAAVVEMFHELGPAFGFQGNTTVVLACHDTDASHHESRCSQATEKLSFRISIDGK
ncbi:hypothetical protein E4U53_006915 [Claviceps sorghi]|nr:hypothetical protein E4U53_006915 [Claviceps sorghi]